MVQSSLLTAQQPSGICDSGQVISLAGEWAFKLDPQQVGDKEQWYQKSLPDVSKLPGSTDEAGYGTRTTKKSLTELSRVYRYVGHAWYQKEIAIPQSWAGKHITLFLERCLWVTNVWVDGRMMGMQESLCVPHIYDLSEVMTPGKHLLTIRVDNSTRYNVGRFTHRRDKIMTQWAHSYTDATQTIWNGIVGRIALEAADPIWVESVQVYPDVRKKIAKTKVRIGNTTGRQVRAMLTLQATQISGPKGKPHSTEVTVNQDKETTVEVDLNMGPDVKLWDEFSPVMYEMITTVAAESGGRKLSHHKKTSFGMRQVGTKGTHITINDRPTFLRGNVDCCAFPLTGYPHMDVEGWLRILKISKSYGLNHVRFHSWCPPEAAFVAADRLGFMFQVEAAVWTEVGSGKPVDRFIYAEADRILKAYGNHPSFTMLAVGNELKGKNKSQFCSEINQYWKQKDPRRLYTGTTGGPETPDADYLVLARKDGLIRLHRGPLGPSTTPDYSQSIVSATKPIVAHEISAWCVYPNLKEISKYTGVLRARNFEAFRDSLTQNHMLDQADDFLMASGKLKNLIFKAGNETMLRTPGIAGFQLLSLQDFPGQGTALVGALDAFWDSKGFITPAEFRQFCNQTVPLLRMPKRIYTTAETFTGDVEIAHFGSAPIHNAVPLWSIEDVHGGRIASGKLDTRTIPIGNGIKLGTISLPLAGVNVPQKMIVTVSLKDTDFKNRWDIWIYPDQSDTTAPAGVKIAHSLNDEVKAALQAGGKVLLLPKRLSPKRSQESFFGPIFWNTLWFYGRGQQYHLGILCKPEHPAFAEFPTDFHTNWQWWNLLEKSTAMILDHFEPSFRPIVQVIDDWNTNKRLGFMFEGKVGKGKLVVCSLDLQNDLDHRPAARQLLSSVLAYMDGEKFSPQHTIDIKLIEDLCENR